MPSIEISAKTLDEAKKNAAEKLGVDVKKLDVTVIEETKGLFGKSSVRIRAEAAGQEAEKPAKAVKAPAKSKAVKPEAVEVEPETVEEEKPAKASKPAAKAKKAPAKSTVAAVAAVEIEEKTSKSAAQDSEGDRPEVVASAEDEAKVSEVVEGLLASANLDAKISSSDRAGKYVNIALDGRDVAHLVGKHGEVLNALQYLVNVIVTQQLHNGVRCTIDGNHYREKREEALTKLATNIANEVAKRGEEAVLDALPAFERRVVHKALAEMEGITTYSEGEEPNRRVVIAPSE